MGIFLAASLGCALPGTDPALGLLALSEFSHTIPLGIGPSLEVHPAMISGSPEPLKLIMSQQSSCHEVMCTH